MANSTRPHSSPSSSKSPSLHDEPFIADTLKLRSKPRLRLMERYDDYWKSNTPTIIEHYGRELEAKKEEFIMRKTIKILEDRKRDMLVQDQKLTRELMHSKKTRNALTLARSYYQKAWGMNIDITNSETDKFTCIVNFDFANGIYPLAFVIDRNTKQILSWCSGALLSAEEENEMKERYNGIEHYFPKILCELRMLTLNKMKLE